MKGFVKITDNIQYIGLFYAVDVILLTCYSPSPPPPCERLAVLSFVDSEASNAFRLLVGHKLKSKGLQRDPESSFSVNVINNMAESRLRFTTQEKSAILKEVHHNGLEPTLRKYKLTIETLVCWQKKFKYSKTESATPIVKEARKTQKAKKPKHVEPEMNAKEEELLKLVASLIIQIVLDEDMPNR